ncbi:MAG: hypothetical protein ACYTGF_03330 [Planctomycetota bacterium]
MTKSEQRAVPTLSWRQIGVVAWLIFVWVTLVWVVSGFPYTRAVHGGARTRTSYGILRWLDVTDGVSRIHPVAATFTILACVAVTAFLVVYGRRTLGNLSPRWQCQNCGHEVTHGFPRSTVCSECGELPNLWKDPWAFWR